MRSFERRLAALEKAARISAPNEVVWSLALNTGEGDFAFINGDWRPCPNARELLRQDRVFKVYIGMSLRALIGPTGPPKSKAPPEPAK